jgi:N-dimethylarginine dimethylaminohydrolase
VAGLPDLVFTANAGLVDGRRFVVSRFRHQERRGEAKYDADWFANGFEVLEIRAEPDICFEGAGDALPFRRSLLAGYRFRSDFKAHSLLAEMLSIPVLSVELVDARFYHLDLTFCPLDNRRAIINPHAWDRYGCAVVERLVPDPLVLELDEALSFCANSVVIGQNIVMPACPPRVGRVLEGWGFNVCVSPVTEFMKAGGGVRCLTLALDVRLGRDISA